MAGMLPGVETARKRRIHHTNHGAIFGSPPSYTPSRQYFSMPHPSLENEGVEDEKLGQTAREAKERLHQRLSRPQAKSLFIRNSIDVSEVRRSEKKQREVITTQVYGSSDMLKNKNKKKKKTKNREEESEEEEEEECSTCAVCLEEHRVGENVVKLPCNHGFHSRCMLPWLPAHPLCPCCRVSIFP
uniref:RING-type E3 ubiquitin transferase n=1 Tax=Opuntia streptacantha TaxID=393608 RepID=A0A7C8YFX6_OPUST